MTCVHHWLLSDPNGPTCMGLCKKCGATREYQTLAPNNEVWRLTPNDKRIISSFGVLDRTPQR